MVLDSVPFCVSPDDTCPFSVTAKRYRLRDDVNTVNKGKERELYETDFNASTLLVLHSTSFHKETWEASLDSLLTLAAKSRPGEKPLLPIREAWVVECPNHGESAVLNQRLFETPPYATEFGCHGYARAVHRFIQKGPVSFSGRKLIGVGHSLGANTMLLLQNLISDDDLNFASLVLVEPMVSPDGAHHLKPLRDGLVAIAKKRRDTWATRNDVRRHLEQQQEKGTKKGGRGKWDERVVDSFVKFGVHPGRDHKLTLACTRQQETAMYMDAYGPTAPVEVLDRICTHIPIHLILGEVKDFIPAHVHDALISPTSGRTYASITRLPDVGHLIPQEKPDELAVAIYKALTQTNPFNYRPKL